jgi:hypothetical protein
MFPRLINTPSAQRALAALRLTRSFLLLEDDYDVDWEVDRDELSRHAHHQRAPLGGRTGPRRFGQVAPAPHACLSPVGGLRSDRVQLRGPARPCKRAKAFCGSSPQSLDGSRVQLSDD